MTVSHGMGQTHPEEGNTMKKITTILSIAALLVVGACAPQKQASPDPGTPTTGGYSSPPAPAPSPEPAPSEDSGIYSFGQAAKYDDGITVKVSAPSTFKPGPYAAGAEGAKHSIVVTITITNGTALPFDPSLAVETLTSGDVEASQIFDSEQLGDKPTTKVLPGRSVKYRAAFAVANPKDLTLGFAPSFEHEELIWTNNVAGI